MKKKEINVDLFAVAPGVWGMKDVFVNIYAVNNPSDNSWVLIDAGLKWSAPKIRKMAEILFGEGSKPSAIVLTHAHFDHVGSLVKLAEEWDVPVYAHHLEIPYLTGVSSYPPPDPSVGGGLLAELSFLYPKGPINITERVISLPQGGRVPVLNEWKYIHTPGHAPGHISLFRESDKVLIAGDAFVTTKQESVIAVLLQLRKLSGPPKYFTPDWLSASVSVEQLANLEPEVVATGHGRPMRGESMRKSLHNLVRDFDKVAIPSQGRYVHQPALMDDSGVVHVPPKNKNTSSMPTLKFLGITAGVLLTMLLFKKGKKNKKNKDIRNAKRLAPVKTTPVKTEPTTKDKWNKLKYSIKKEAKNLGKPIKNEWKDVKNAAKRELGKATNNLEKIKEPLQDKFEKLKFPVRKELRKIKKLTR